LFLGVIETSELGRITHVEIMNYNRSNNELQQEQLAKSSFSFVG
jgi:hypothetical protein